jgi:hypothetical protein
MINEILNRFFGSRVEPRRFDDIDQIDGGAVTGLFNQLVARQVAEQQRRSRRGRNPYLFDRTSGLDR